MRVRDGRWPGWGADAGLVVLTFVPALLSQPYVDTSGPDEGGHALRHGLGPHGFQRDLHRRHTRSVVVFTGTNFGIKEKKAATTNKALVDAATCHMLGKPKSSNSPTG